MTWLLGRRYHTSPFDAYKCRKLSAAFVWGNSPLAGVGEYERSRIMREVKCEQGARRGPGCDAQDAYWGEPPINGQCHRGY